MAPPSHRQAPRRARHGLGLERLADERGDPPARRPDRLPKGAGRSRASLNGMASGAERFRIDLALRLGLAGVLLHRTGAQFSTLWLDEPFAAQDSEALEALLQSEPPWSMSSA
jgi:hypothetical protein